MIGLLGIVVLEGEKGGCDRYENGIFFKHLLIKINSMGLGFFVVGFFLLDALAILAQD